MIFVTDITSMINTILANSLLVSDSLEMEQNYCNKLTDMALPLCMEPFSSSGFCATGAFIYRTGYVTPQHMRHGTSSSSLR